MFLRFEPGELFGLIQPTPEPAATPLPTVSVMPTNVPTPSPTPEPTPEYFTISFVGDCTLGCTPANQGLSSSFLGVVKDDYAFPFAATRDYLEADYLTIANMEGTFTTATMSSGALFTFKADPVYAKVFTEGSVELVTLGNNHAGDYLEQGRADTRAALEAEGIAYVDEDGIALYQKGDGPVIGVYSKLYPTAGQLIDGVQRLKEAGAEIIIAAPHWGIEGSYRPTLDQIAGGRAAIDAGASIVYGSHPHVLQPVEEYGTGCILYSLANWSFGGNTNPRDRDTAIAQFTVRRDPDGSLHLEAPVFIPCKLSGSDGANDYQPQPYAPDTPEYARTMSKLDGSWSGADLSIDYSAFH